jgi:hypothetical protein
MRRGYIIHPLPILSPRLISIRSVKPSLAAAAFRCCGQLTFERIGTAHAGGYFFLGSIPPDDSPIIINGAVHITCAILSCLLHLPLKLNLVRSSLMHKKPRAKVLRLVLKELGHPQPPIPIHIDNTTTVGIVNNTIKRQRSRAMEMRYFWLLDAEAQRLFRFYYQPGQENLGGYPSKHHSANIHQHICPYYVRMDNSPTSLPRAAKPSTQRGCAETLGDPHKGRIPLPSIPYYRARDLSRHLT